MSVDRNSADQGALAGQRIALIGRLTGMSHRETGALISDQQGQLVAEASDMPTIVVIADRFADFSDALESAPSAASEYADLVATGNAELWKESELWQRLGLVEQTHGVQQLYTPAMLAELLEVPLSAIRRWHRSQVLKACRNVRRLPYFDFQEVAVARHLANLFHAGCSLHVIERKLAELHRSLPGISRPLADPALVVEGKRLVLRRGDELAEPGGQLLIDFDKSEDELDQQQATIRIASHVEAISSVESESVPTVDDLRLAALECEDAGELDKAAEIYRTLLISGHYTPETHFALADLLYRMGDLAAARERFYVAIELDEEYVEARANLGCVLAEIGELAFAEAAFEGALAYHPDYVDVHYHLANLLDRSGKAVKAETHWRKFLELAPESPWADTARDRLQVQMS